MALRKILALIDPTSDIQPAFERALDSALDTGAALHLFACANSETGLGNKDEAAAALEAMLQSLAARAVDAGIQVEYEHEWEEDWGARAVSAAARCGASMLFKNSVDHSPVQRELHSTSDWTLLRTSPCPVLMVKNFHDWGKRRVLAAINPLSTEIAHVRLGNQIISFTRRLAAGYGSEANFVTAYQDLNYPPDTERIAADCGVPPERVHARQGKAADTIRSVAAELEVDLIILGTVARDGIKGRVIGNTCERLLDQTHADVLVLN